MRPRTDSTSFPLVQAATNVCADGSGGVIDPHTLVSDAVASGLPAASETGVVFMRVSVGDSANCGPYECESSLL